MIRRLMLISWLAVAFGPAPAQPTTDNLLLSDHGTRVVAFSSEYGSGWEASNLTPARADFDPSGSVVRPLVWSSAPDAPFPHWLLFDLGKPTWITTLVFDNFLAEETDHPGISAREIEIWTGTREADLHKAAAFELLRNVADQAVKITPVEARFLKLVIRSNFGHPWYTELGATRAFDDGSRPNDLAARLVAEGKVELYGLYFDFGSASLRAESDTLLDEIAAFALAEPRPRLVVEGHTDSIGDEAANLTLSKERAQAVVGALVARGVVADRLAIEAYGESRPLASNDTLEGRAVNRRVSLRLAAGPG